MLIIIFAIGVLILLVVYYVVYQYKIITGKSEFWKKMRRDDNIENAFRSGDFKVFEELSLSARKERSKGKDKTK